MSAFTIKDFRYIQRSGVGVGGVWKNKPLWVAKVELNGGTIHVSRFDEEKTWYADSAFTAKGIPLFCHGEGSRCCLKRPVNDDVHKALQDMKDNHSGELEEVYGL